ncbi:RNA ligase family protein [Aliikangiella coralliicola]|uniref:2'-5' RNA ligase n=1 Tax=Aliikangiella coralliicola TaxID=2592383 RepID=A0A545TV82_9GAMM|nr:RNA ligase family protein [Aliikangiella coralliicola]TQV81071.1 2'-5' RNA ligase [Aliikangiella coralliicola]
MNTRYKYPRTPHLPWSPGATKDDTRCVTTDIFVDKKIVITEKMDGENTTLYNDHTHARSVDSRHHSSRNWIKRLHAAIAHEIPGNWRICGENLYAQHSIVYEQLSSYFYGFSIWNEENFCLSWTETMEWFEVLGLTAPPVIYRGLWDEKLVRSINVDVNSVEGYVVRLENKFHYGDFDKSVAKWVRGGHVQTDKHWMYSEIKTNGLACPSKTDKIDKEKADESK